MSNKKDSAHETIVRHMKDINQEFIKAKISGVCLYASVLLKERLDMEGISVKLVLGYLQTNRGIGELFRHVWLELNDDVYDVSIDILKNVSWKSQKVQFTHHKTLPSNLCRTDINDNFLDYGIFLYQSNPFKFWSEFDNCAMPEIHRQIAPVINKLRDSFLGLD